MFVSLRGKGARTRFLDQEEIQRLLEKASDDLKPILTTALHTGMRRGELFALAWRDVDLRNRLITVRESKSGKIRQIPVDDTLAETLGGLPSRFKKGLVFPSPSTGEKRTDLKKAFGTATKTTELEDVRFHDLRHTFASHLVMNGVDLKTVQELLGHHSLNMTMKYAHLAPDHRTRAIKTLDTAYRKENCTITAQSSETGEGQSL